MEAVFLSDDNSSASKCPFTNATFSSEQRALNMLTVFCLFMTMQVAIPMMMIKAGSRKTESACFFP